MMYPQLFVKKAATVLHYNLKLLAKDNTQCTAKIDILE